MMGFHLLSQNIEVSVDINPATLSKAGANGSLDSDTTTANAVGGQLPYTFAWSFVSGDSFTINSPTGQSTNFTASGTNEIKVGIYKCIVTDDNSDTAEDTVQVSFTFGTPP